jgi:internalin A
MGMGKLSGRNKFCGGCIIMTDMDIIKRISDAIGFELTEGDEERGYVLNDKGEVTELNITKAGLKSLEEIIEDLTELKSLTALNLSENNIDNIKPLKVLDNLTNLNLYDNDVRDITALQYLTDLKVLNLGLSYDRSRNIITSAGLTSLEEQKNSIRDLTHLKGLVQMNSLNLRSNQVSDLNPLKDMVQMISLNLRRNQVSDLTPLKDMGNLESINLYNNQVRDLTPLKDMGQMNSLDLWNNQVSDLTPLKDMGQMNSLNLFNNQVSDLTPLKDMGQMNSLNLWGNQVSDLTPLKDMGQMNSLNLGYNQVSDLTPLKGLVKLETLYLFNNQVSDLTPLKGLVNLNTLHLASNQVSDLTPLKGMVKLNELDLKYNKINTIESWITDFKMKIIYKNAYIINTFNLSGNPIENVPIEIIEQGKQAIKDYFAGIEKEGIEYLYESKLLIIGEGGVGKTSFAAKLQNENADLPEEEDTTLGIDVGQWEFKFKDKIHGDIDRTFYVNLWDFGGQKIYRGTHQIFFCNKTFYVLIDDTRDNKTDFAYWLNSAEQFAGDKSSLLIIFNIKEDHTPVFDKAGYMSRFGDFIKAIIEVDLKNKKNQVIRMQKKVKDLLLELPGIGDPLPVSWVKIRKELLDEKDNCISYDKFKAICSKFGIHEISKIETLSGYLNRIGVFTHFIADELLYDRIYLDSNWLVKKLYKVLDHELIKKNKGTIFEEDINKIWKEDNSSIEKKKLTQLMHKFGLMYQVIKSSKYVVPAYLSSVMPYKSWEYNKKSSILEFIFEFDKYMPDGLFPKIIVALHKFITNQDNVWRRGVNIEYERTYAEIIETYEAVNRYKIRIWGVNKEGLLAIIREKIKEELAPYEKLNPRELIPCICSVCQGLDEPHYYQYSDLRRRQEKGKQTVECEKSYADMRVDELLKIIVPIETVIRKTEEKEIRIFLASSNDLKEERKEMDGLFERINMKYSGKGISFKPVMWKRS